MGVATSPSTQGTQLIGLSHDDKEFIDTADLVRESL